MYIVIGSDSREYGPVDLATLQQWVQAGSVIRETSIVDARTGQRLQAGQIAPLQPLFVPQATVLYGADATPAAFPSSYQPKYTASTGVQSRKIAALSAVLAVAVLGCLGLFKVVAATVHAHLARSGVPREVAVRDDHPLKAPQGRSVRGPVYFVPVGHTQQAIVDDLTGYYRQHLGIPVEVLPRIELPASTLMTDRQDQYAVNDTITLLRRNYAEQGATCVIGIADADMNDRFGSQRFVFSYRWHDNSTSYGIISTARLNPGFFEDSPDPELAASRLRKLATKMIGFLYYRLPPSSDPESPLSDRMVSLTSIDSRRQGF